MKQKLVKISVIVLAIIASIIITRIWMYTRPQKLEGTMIVYDVKCENPDEAARYEVEYLIVMQRFLTKEPEPTVKFEGTVIIDSKEYEVSKGSDFGSHYYLRLAEPSEEFVKFPEEKVRMMIMHDFSFMAIQHVDMDEYCKGPADSYEEAKNLSSPLFDEIK